MLERLKIQLCEKFSCAIHSRGMRMNIIKHAFPVKINLWRISQLVFVIKANRQETRFRHNILNQQLPFSAELDALHYKRQVQVTNSMLVVMVLYSLTTLAASFCLFIVNLLPISTKTLVSYFGLSNSFQAYIFSHTSDAS